jgi:hypothetical protein
MELGLKTTQFITYTFWSKLIIKIQTFANNYNAIFNRQFSILEVEFQYL